MKKKLSRTRRTKARSTDAPTAGKVRKSGERTIPRTRNEIANDSARCQLARPFAMGLKMGLRRMQLEAVQSLLHGAALDAIERWEEGKLERARFEFFVK